MSSWKKVKGLFWQSGDPNAPEELPEGELSDAEFQELLSQSPHAVPASEEPVPVDVSNVRVAYGGSGGEAQIDFQALYDEAGIPNTDEVEQLENFLSRLDASLPHASKLGTAQAFLGAIGKGKDDVLEDARRKIQRVRGVLTAKEQETSAAVAHEQTLIADLEQQIEKHKQRMESLTRDFEGVRQACTSEESRLQAARVFFGSIDQLGS